MWRAFPCLLAAVISSTCMAQSFHIGNAKAPEAGSMFVYPERIRLKNRDFFTAHRGLMFLPINRSKPDSEVIGVEFYFFPRSEEANPDTPPLFQLNGGPGFPGLQDMLSRRGTFEDRLQSYTAMTDVIVVGQRGIGYSKPNTVIVQPNPPQLHKRNDPAEVRKFQDKLQSERQFWLDQGVDLSGFNAIEAAADVHDVAKALGFEKIMISGGSFGSHWGMTIMRNYPDLVARAVLHGMEGPDHTWDHPGWIWNVYKRVAQDAEAADVFKGKIPEGGLIKAIETLVSQADEAPFKVTLNKGTRSEAKVMLDGIAMRELARGFSVGGLRAWPADVIALTLGDLEKPASMIRARSRMGGSSTRTASYWVLDSSSGITAERRQEFESDPALKVISSTFDFYVLGSPLWEVDLGDEFRQNFKTQIPTVIVHGTWDTSTPYENAQELAPFFENSKFVTVERGSHGAIGEARAANKEFREALAKFMATGDMSNLPDKVELETPRWKVPETANANGNDKR